MESPVSWLHSATRGRPSGPALCKIVTTSKMFTYQSFVDELMPLIAQAQGLIDADGMHQNAAFRKWRHEVTDLIQRIERVGYEINCQISSRRFGVAQVSYTESATAAQRMKGFNRDLRDTINELSTIIDRFSLYGDPSGAHAPSTIVAPSKEISLGANPNAPRAVKENFYSHPVVWVSSLVIGAWVTGFAARGYLLPKTAEGAPRPVVNCRIEGLTAMDATHNTRVDTLQKELVSLVNNASNRDFIQIDQDNYRDAAERVRRDIAAENTSYQLAIQQLNKNCQ